MHALQKSVLQKSHADALDGAPSRRGRFTITSDEIKAHSEIAAALGEEDSFAISASADPSAESISAASDLAHTLLTFWIKQNDWASDDRRVPPGQSSQITDAVSQICMVPATTARRIVSVAASRLGWQLMSMGGWEIAEEVKA